jgi:hypothetical protein
LLEEVNAVMKLSHTLGYLLRGFRDTQIVRRQCSSIEELLKSTIKERSKQTRTNFPSGKAPKDLQFILSINQVFNLGP